MDISFVILTWNSEKYIDKCLKSIFADVNKTQYSFDIFLVDNGSIDSTRYILQSFKDKYPYKIIPIFLEKNTGTTYSRNLALKKTTGEFIVIMDSDVEIRSGVTKELITTLVKDEKTGLIAPKLVYPNGKLQKSTDCFPTIFTKFFRYFFLKVLEKRDNKLQRERNLCKVDYAISAMWVLKREVFKKVGLLDENIFYAPEDVDYCLRVWRAGYNIVYHPGVFATHHTQEISRGLKINMSTLNHICGLIYYFRKHRYCLRKPFIDTNKIIWIAWEEDGSIRSKVLSRAIVAEFYTFTLFEGSTNILSFLRYPTAIMQTFFKIIKESPKILVVQNPSIVLSFFSALWRPFFGYTLVVDLHTLYIYLKGVKKIIVNALNNFSLRNGNIIIVTNDPYKNKIKEKTNKEIFVLPDMIPDFDYEFMKVKLQGKNNILFICTFSEDEPWQEVIKAANYLDKNIYIYITGKNMIKKKDVPSNIVLTGFLSDKDYQNLLRSVEIIMVLTSQEDCMVCGGYEAVAAEKPLILSNKKVLRQYFNLGTVFTQNDSKAIAESISLAVKNKSNLRQEIKALKGLRKKEWEKRWKNLVDKLSC